MVAAMRVLVGFSLQQDETDAALGEACGPLPSWGQGLEEDEWASQEAHRKGGLVGAACSWAEYQPRFHHKSESSDVSSEKGSAFESLG